MKLSHRRSLSITWWFTALINCRKRYQAVHGACRGLGNPRVRRSRALRLRIVGVVTRLDEPTLIGLLYAADFMVAAYVHSFHGFSRAIAGTFLRLIKDGRHLSPMDREAMPPSIQEVQALLIPGPVRAVRVLTFATIIVWPVACGYQFGPFTAMASVIFRVLGVMVFPRSVFAQWHAQSASDHLAKLDVTTNTVLASLEPQALAILEDLLSSAPKS